MIVEVKIETLSDLFRAADASVGGLARSMGVSHSTVSCKLHGRRGWYNDEVGALVKALNASGALVTKVKRADVIELLGAERTMQRRTLAVAKEVQSG